MHDEIRTLRVIASHLENLFCLTEDKSARVALTDCAGELRAIATALEYKQRLSLEERA